MHYRDRDRLFLSTFLASLIFSVLFLVLLTLRWGDFDPFPDLSDPIIVDLESFPDLEETASSPRGETPEVRASPTEIETVIPEPVTEETSTPAAPASAPPPSVAPPKPAAPVPRAAEPPPLAPAAPPVAARPAPRTDSPAPPAPAPPRSSPAPAASPARPSSETPGARPSPEALATSPGPSFRPQGSAGIDSGMDTAAAAELKFKEEQLAALGKWLSENAPEVPLSGEIASAEASAATTGGERPPVTDPMTAMQLQKYEALAREIQTLRSQTGEAAAASERQPARTSAQPGSPAPVTVKDSEGRDLGRGFLGGRSPGGLDLKIRPEDFDGPPPPEIKIEAEFSIDQAGIVDPGSLKLTGDKRYTRVTEKIEKALKEWKFSSSPGVTTKARISFIIRMEKK